MRTTRKPSSAQLRFFAPTMLGWNCALAMALMVGLAAGQVTYTSCGVTHTLGQTPSRVITLNQGVTELMLAMGLQDKMVGTAYLDDEIWPRYGDTYATIPVLSGASYPDEGTIMGVNPDFILGSYKSAFRERTCEGDECKGIFSGPCAGSGSDFFESGSGETQPYSTCRPQLHAQGIGTWLEPVSCEDSALKPEGGATEETVYAAIRQIGAIFDVPAVAEQLVSEIKNEFAIAEQSVQGLGSQLKAVWLDCVDCCDLDDDSRGLFIGAGTGAPNLIMEEAGMTNVFADEEGSWACVHASQILDAEPDVMVIVDASWDTAMEKIEFLHNHVEFCGADFVQRADYITIPFSASTLGPRNGAAALDMVSAALHVTTGSPGINFKSGVDFFDPEALATHTAELLCPIDVSKVKYGNSYTPEEDSDDDAGQADSSGSSGDLPGWGIILVSVVSVLFVGALGFLFVMYRRERQGSPIFPAYVDMDSHNMNDMAKPEIAPGPTQA